MGVVSLVECLSSIHEALSSIASAPHKPGMASHSRKLSVWERGRQEDQKFTIVSIV